MKHLKMSFMYIPTGFWPKGSKSGRSPTQNPVSKGFISHWCAKEAKLLPGARSAMSPVLSSSSAPTVPTKHSLLEILSDSRCSKTALPTNLQKSHLYIYCVVNMWFKFLENFFFAFLPWEQKLWLIISVDDTQCMVRINLWNESEHSLLS